MRSAVVKILFLALLMQAYSCKKGENDNLSADKTIDRFIGDYEVLSTHKSGLHNQRDSSGAVIWSGYITEDIYDSLLTIRKSGFSDTLIIIGLLKSLSSNHYEVKAVLEHDSLRITYEHGSSTRNNYIRGYIRIDNDSLFLDYYWSESDIWSPGAYPISGSIKAKGKRI